MFYVHRPFGLFAASSKTHHTFRSSASSIFVPSFNLFKPYLTRFIRHLRGLLPIVYYLIQCVSLNLINLLFSRHACSLTFLILELRIVWCVIKSMFTFFVQPFILVMGFKIYRFIFLRILFSSIYALNLASWIIFHIRPW